MGNHFVRISVPDWVQVHQRPWKCWQTLQVAYSYSGSPRNNRCRCLHSGTTGLITSYCRAAWKRYPLLSKLSQTFHQIWLAPKKWRVNCLKSYWNRRQGLSVEGDCVLWGIRVIVPKKLQNEVLREFHREHQGIARMKAIARSYVWWPGLEKCLENVAKNCRMCKSVNSAPTVAPLHLWPWPSRPWQRVHVDFPRHLREECSLCWGMHIRSGQRW